MSLRSTRLWLGNRVWVRALWRVLARAARRPLLTPSRQVYRAISFITMPRFVFFALMLAAAVMSIPFPHFACLFFVDIIGVSVAARTVLQSVTRNIRAVFMSLAVIFLVAYIWGILGARRRARACARRAPSSASRLTARRRHVLHVAHCRRRRGVVADQLVSLDHRVLVDAADHVLVRRRLAA